MRKRNLSLVYLVWGTLAIIGFLAFFQRWPQPFISLFALAIPFYFASLTLLIWVHPIVCAVYVIKKYRKNLSHTTEAIHLIWSAIIASAFMGMIMNGYIITA